MAKAKIGPVTKIGAINLVVAMALCGCGSGNGAVSETPKNAPPLTNDESIDISLVDAVHDSNIREGILEQHTLYPYQFVTNSAELNDLGKRDFAVLLDSLKTVGGDLNVRKGDTADALYNQRVALIQKSLADSGVDMSRVRISDGMPGGDGIAGADQERITKLEHAREAQNSTSGGNGTSMQDTSTDSTSAQLGEGTGGASSGGGQ